MWERSRTACGAQEGVWCEDLPLSSVASFSGLSVGEARELWGWGETQGRELFQSL